MAREHDVAETRCEPFELRLDRVGHVDRGPVRYVAVRPERVLARRSARVVEQALLRDEYEWPLRMTASADLGFGGDDLVFVSAYVHGSGVPARVGLPRNRFRERVVQLECGGAALEPAQCASDTRCELVSCDSQSGERTRVQEHRARRWKVGDVRDRGVGDDLAAVRADDRGEHVGDALGTAADRGPADRVRRGTEDERERCGCEVGQR